MVTVSSGTDTANEIGGLASELQENAQLRDLERALRSLTSTPPDAGRARKWATVDLFAAFLSEEPVVSETGRIARFWQAVDTAVQVLVFVPIALTWLGLTMAASAYRAAEANGSLGGESFLQGWQTGFGGKLPGWATFDHVALYTFCIVFVLVIGTAALIIHKKMLEVRQAELRRRLVAALTNADLELAPFRLGLPERVAKELDIAADKLNGTVSAIETVGQVAARSQQKAADALTAVVPALASVETAATAASTAANALERAPDRFSGHLDQMTQATGGVAAAQHQLVSAAGDASKKIADALQYGAGQVRASLTDVSATANNYTGRLERTADILGHAHEVIGVLPVVVSELRGDVANMHANIADIGSQISDLTTAVASAKDAVPGPGEWSAPFQAVADNLRKSAEDLRTAAVALQWSLERQSPERQTKGSQSYGDLPTEREGLDAEPLGVEPLDGQAPNREPLDRESPLVGQSPDRTSPDNMLVAGEPPQHADLPRHGRARLTSKLRGHDNHDRHDKF